VTLQAETTAAQISAPALAARPTLHRYLCGSFCEFVRFATWLPMGYQAHAIPLTLQDQS